MYVFVKQLKLLYSLLIKKFKFWIILQYNHWDKGAHNQLGLLYFSIITIVPRRKNSINNATKRE